MRRDACKEKTDASAPRVCPHSTDPPTLEVQEISDLRKLHSYIKLCCSFAGHEVSTTEASIQTVGETGKAR